MLSFLRAMLGGKTGAKAAAAPAQAAPDEIVVDGAPPFPIARTLALQDGFPLVDWGAVEAWIAKLDEARRNDAWNACERAWLLHFAAALGPDYRLAESVSAIVLSTLEDQLARVTLGYMDRTLLRVTRTLDGLARTAETGKEILIVFDDDDTYYRYVSIGQPDGEYARSGGMFLGRGCGHFITTKADLRMMEPVIAHEMTHACLGHLDLPLWLNEGLAVNTEQRLCDGGRPLFTPQEMHDKHLAFWNETRMQAFWEGGAFYTAGDDSTLAYDLARIIVQAMARDWDTFKAFALEAKAADAGAAAARRHLGVDLGEYACALVEKPWSPSWSPRPSRLRLSACAPCPSRSRSARVTGPARSPR